MSFCRWLLLTTFVGLVVLLPTNFVLIAKVVAQQPSEIESASDRTLGRIIGGNRVREGAHPWAVALARQGLGSNTRSTFCSGSLIHRQWVLTAAHCVTSPVDRSMVIQANALKVLIGNVDLERARAVRVDRVFVHGQYASRNLPDLALLRLEEAVDLPILELLERDDAAAGAGSLLTAIGWGVTKEQGSVASQYLRQVELPVIGFDECRSHWQGSINRTAHLCAGVDVGGKDACFGDSGGALFAIEPGTGESRLAGIVSFGQGCARPDTPGVYASVSPYLPWIRSRTGTTPAAAAAAELPIVPSVTTECRSLICTFDGSASTSGSQGIKTWLWNFGDGVWDTGATVQHAYGRAGDYRVTLHLIDPRGNMVPAVTVVNPTTVVASTDVVKRDYQGAIGSKQLIIFPDGDGFRSRDGQIRARVDMPRDTDADLVLLKRNAATGRWREVSSSSGRGYLEYVRYSGSAGQYMWTLRAASGSGQFRVRTQHYE